MTNESELGLGQVEKKDLREMFLNLINGQLKTWELVFVAMLYP